MLRYLLIIALAACGGGGAPVAQTSTGVATDTPEAAIDVTAVVAERKAPVPKASDPNERLVFIKAGSVWMMKADGSEATQLTIRSHDAADEAPALSPTGNQLAYVSPHDGLYKIYVMSFSELIPRAITDGDDGGDTAPAWSPNGKRIAFMRGDPRDKRDLYVVDTTGGEPRLLHKGINEEPDYAGTPAWSPDGNYIVFAGDRRTGKGTLLWIIDVRTKQLRRLTAPLQEAWFVIDRQPTWSPDGNRIVFASNRHVTNGDLKMDFDIYAINPDGSGLTRLTDDPGAASDPTYSPDGKRVIFVSTRAQQNPYEVELYVMAAEGGVQRRLTRDERPQNTAPSAGRTK